MSEPDKPFNGPRIVDQHGQPAVRKSDLACPGCGSGKDRRVRSGGFGEPHPVCNSCGFEFHGEKCE